MEIETESLAGMELYLKPGQSDRVSTVCVSRWDKEAPLEESQKPGDFFIPFAYANGTDPVATATGSYSENNGFADSHRFVDRVDQLYRFEPVKRGHSCGGAIDNRVNKRPVFLQITPLLFFRQLVH